MSFIYDFRSNFKSLKNLKESYSNDSTKEKLNDESIIFNPNSTIPNFKDSNSNSLHNELLTIFKLLSESKSLQKYSNRITRFINSRIRSIQNSLLKNRDQYNYSYEHSNKLKQNLYYEYSVQKVSHYHNVDYVLNISNKIIKHLKDSYHYLNTWELSSSYTGITYDANTYDLCLRNLISNKIVIKSKNKYILDDFFKYNQYEHYSGHLYKPVNEPTKGEIKKFIKKYLENAGKDDMNIYELKHIVTKYEINKQKANKYVQNVTQNKIEYLYYNKDVKTIYFLEID